MDYTDGQAVIRGLLRSYVYIYITDGTGNKAHAVPEGMLTDDAFFPDENKDREGRSIQGAWRHSRH